MRQRQGLFFVNALSGLFLFLLFHTMDIFNNTDVCQRPKRAFLISTYFNGMELDLNGYVVSTP